MIGSKQQRILLGCMAGVVLAAVAAFVWLCTRSANIAFLPAHEPAEWIVYPTPANGMILPVVELSTEFRRSFTVQEVPKTARLSIRAFKHCSINVNGSPVVIPEMSKRNWKDVADQDIAALLKVGTNEVSVRVYNSNGPPALWMTIEGGSTRLHTDETWEASYIGAAWKSAQLATTPVAINKGNPILPPERPLASLSKRVSLYLIFAVIVAGAVVALEWQRRRELKLNQPPKLYSERGLGIVVVGLIGIWVILWSNNIGMLPEELGFDSRGHLDYIQYILDHKALPLANDGWEMFQPPLYYLFSAVQLYILGPNTFEGDGLFVLRLSAMLFGIINIILVFLSLRLIFPGQLRKQFFGTLLAGLLPQNIYLCHYTTNEIPSGTLAAASIYLCLRIIRNPQVSISQHAILGVLMGAAILTKTTMIVISPAIMLVLLWNLWQKGARSPRSLLFYLGCTLFCCLAVSGWHYARVAAHFGKPFVGDWDPESGYAWWQQPGYQTSSYYWGFGRSVVQPFYAVFEGFADGIYSTLWGDGLYGGLANSTFRPPWNYEMMAAGYLLAILPMIGMLIGLGMSVIQFIKNPRTETLLLLSVSFLMGTFLIYFSLKIPIYAVVKSFYGLAALIPICAFGALGMDALAQKAGKLRYLLLILLGVWALNVCGAFWIQKDSEKTEMWLARFLRAKGNQNESVARLTKVLEKNPKNPVALRLMASLEFDLGQPEKARQMVEEAVRLAPEDTEGGFILLGMLVQQNKLEEAVACARQLLARHPDHGTIAMKLAECLDKIGRNGEAISAYREALRIEPTNPDAHHKLALALEEEGDPNKALVEFRLAALLEPDSAEMHDNFGLALLKADKLEDAVRNFARAAKLAPQNATYRFHVGVGLGRQRKAGEAVEVYRQALQLDPNLANAMNNLAWILATTSDPQLRNPKEAVEIAKKACELSDWKVTVFLETLGVSYAEAGNFEEAVATLRKELELTRSQGDSQRSAKVSKLIEAFSAKRPYQEALLDLDAK